MTRIRPSAYVMIAALAAASPGAADEGTLVSCKGVKTSDWAAFNDLMPPPPDHFYVKGKVTVGNPGITPKLAERTPQGINPAYLLLDLQLWQASGPVIQPVVTKDVRYDKDGVRYRQVSIFCENEEIEKVDVGDVH